MSTQPPGPGPEGDAGGGLSGVQRAGIVLGALGVLLTVFVILQGGDDSGIDAALADGRRPAAPALELPPLDGGPPRSLDDFRGKVVVLNFWASWCGPCRDEAPLLQRWYERIEPQGGTVLGVDALDATANARAFVRRYGVRYPNLRDASAAHLKPYGVSGYPETFVLDRRGRIAALTRGPVTEEFLARELPPLLRERS
jgi:cytochrome c biogenesis protein CcmG/thiol:disulfide interchange protein DsbE